MRKKLRQGQSILSESSHSGSDYWNSLSWKPVDLSDTDLGSFQDTVFFGLEELDGNSYLEQKKQNNNKKNQTNSSSNDSENDQVNLEPQRSGKKRKIDKISQAEEEGLPSSNPSTAKKQKKKKDLNNTFPPNKSVNRQSQDSDSLDLIITSKAKWDNILLVSCLRQSLITLDFQHPTPIQSSSIPKILSSEETNDIVGIAETGSGKTLAFVLPILHSIITWWDYCKSCKIPIALILSPTRELSMQISNVIKDITKVLQLQHPFLKIKCATVVGGMSEDKQRRLLSTRKTPLHIVIATPGRLHEIFKDLQVEAFADLSQIKYLVVDEADRMMEEGHFSELYRIFSRFRDHDEIVRRGENVRDVLRKRQEGVPEIIENENERDEFDEEIDDIHNEEEEEEIVDVIDATENMEEAIHFPEESDSFISFGLQRQTLLFTATGLETSTNKKVLEKSYLSGKQSKKLKLKGTVKGLASDCSLPTAIKELLSVVAIQPTIRVIDVTHNTAGDLIDEASLNDDDNASILTTDTTKSMIALPKYLVQYELRIPTEDKDMYTYYYLLNNEGRTLIFVNSIKTARRLDGLLRALQFHCRTIHGDLPQRQRIKALETFQSSPRGILVATDIAARGLDVAKITSVIHYDIARTPQVYIHRSGRTARANNAGRTISFVTPDEYGFHQVIVEYITGKKKSSSSASSIQTYKVEPNVLPYLRERIQLAKKTFTLSFVLSHELKEKHWLEEQAQQSDLALDDYLMEDLYDLENSNSSSSKNKEEGSSKKGKKLIPETEKHRKQKQQLQQLRRELTILLETPIPSISRLNNPVARSKTNPSSKQSSDWRKRKVGFFVYTPPT